MGRMRTFALVVACVLVDGVGGSPSLRSWEDDVPMETVDVKPPHMYKNRTVASMSWWEILRALFIEEGSSCLLSGGGVVPYFNSCIGCSLVAAEQCVDDMRSNVSFNVPVNCKMDSVGSMAGAYTNFKKIENRRCCALENNEFTYAYKDALSCLISIYCTESDTYTNLVDECETVCPVLNESVWEKACTPSQRSSGTSLAPAWFTAALSAALAAALALSR